MLRLWKSIVSGYLQVIEPVAAYLVRRRVSPNTLTTVGTLCTIAGGISFASGHIMLAGWIVGLTAIFDVLDGTVARRTGTASVFGAFYDSTLDRVADGVLLGGIAYFFATSATHRNELMMAVSLAGILGTFLVSYTRARAESLGIDAKVGVMQRPERVVLLSVPQAFFGLALGGWVLAGVVTLLAVTAWITAVQRILCVRREATGVPARAIREAADARAPAPARRTWRALS